MSTCTPKSVSLSRALYDMATKDGVGTYLEGCSDTRPRSEWAMKADALKIYPNPASHQLIISLDTHSYVEPVNITIANGIGAILREATIHTSQSTIDVSDLPNGLYNLRTNTGYSAQFIKID